MSPVRACPTCNVTGCTRHRPTPARRRAYSDTAEYRRVEAEALELYGRRCVLYCGQPIDEDLVLAHVIPHADGGAFTVDNVRPAHRDCNARAGATVPEEGSHDG